jgi:hypothetical protein
MLGEIVLLTIVPIALLVIAFFISRALFRIVMSVMTIVFIILIAVGGFVIYDAYRFSDSLETGTNRFVFANASAGVEAINETISELDAQGLERDANGTVFTVYEAFISDNATAGFDTANVSSAQALEAIASEDPHAAFAQSLTNDEFMREIYESSLRDSFDETLMRSYLFGQLLSSTLEIEGSNALIIGIREGKIGVEPDRIVLRFIRMMPSRVIEQTLSIEVD